LFPLRAELVFDNRIMPSPEAKGTARNLIGIELVVSLTDPIGYFV
jgi:RNase adaptor protein for sRNA GlmZ degradation